MVCRSSGRSNTSLLQAIVLGLSFAFIIGFALTGCGDNKPTAASGGLPIIEGAYVPETGDEGVPIPIEVWGSAPSDGWTLSGFSMGDPSNEVVTVMPYGRGSGSMGDGYGHGSFRGSASVPGLSAGAHTIRIIGARGPMDFPIHILPRDAMVRMTVLDPARRGNRQLVITNDGAAIAYEVGEGFPTRIMLPFEEIDRIRGLFRAAGFMDLRNRYVLHDPPEGLVYAIAFRPNPDAAAKRVVAEDAAAPQELRDLASQLMQLIDRILLQNPERPPVVGLITLDPPTGAPGTARTVTLSLHNRTADTLSLHFATQQMFDILVLTRMGDADSLGCDRDGWMDGDGGGMDGHDGGMMDGRDGGMMDGHDGTMDGHDVMGGLPGDGDPDDPMRMRPLLLWNWAYGQTFGPDPSTLRFLPDEVRTFTFTWPGTRNDGVVVEAGIYGVAGRVLSRPFVPVRPAEVVVEQTPPGP